MNDDSPLTTSHGIDNEAARVLAKRSSTHAALNRYDLDGDGKIDPDEAKLMAKDLNKATKQVAVVENDKKKYKKVAGITGSILVLTLVANFGLTVATIFLTRQFSIDSDGNLLDKSTGDVLNTNAKAHGNVVGVTFGPEAEECTGRELCKKDNQRELLTDTPCYASTTMQHQVYLEYLAGTTTHYVIEIDGETSGGVVIDGSVTHKTSTDGQNLTCNLYKNIRVQSEPGVAYQMECCGRNSGNCCINRDMDHAQQGARLLKSEFC